MPERRFDAPTAEPSELERLRREAGDEDPARVEKNTRKRSRSAALEMKHLGATFAEIARVLEFESPSAARQAVEQAIIDSGSFEGDKENMRALLGLRLDRWHRSIASKIIDSSNPAQLEYMAMGLRLVERQARLFGLDAPTRVELHNADDNEIRNLIGAYQERLGISRPQEGNPFELVEGDDGVWTQPDGMDVEDDDD